MFISSIRWLLVLLVGLGSLPAARASHLRGGDIAYTSVAATTAGVPRYHVVIRCFADNGSTALAAPTAVRLLANRSGCGVAAPDTFSVRAPLSQTLNGSQLTCSSTNIYYFTCFYEVDINLPAAQWVLSSTIGSRLIGIVNMSNSGVQNCYLSAYLDNTLTTQDASPVVQSLLQPAFDLNALATATYNLSAFDANGDSLRYELVLPASTCASPIALFPSTFTPHFAVNVRTGLLTPTVASVSTQGYYNVTVRVSEYRRINGSWQLIGYVIRDTVYLLFPNGSGNHPPTFATMWVNGGPAQSPSQTILMQPGQTANILLEATDPDLVTLSQVLRFSGPAAGVVPGLTFARIGTTNTVQLTWQVPATQPPGRYTVLASVFDSGCIYNASEERAIVFVVGGVALAAGSPRSPQADAYPMPFHDQVQFSTAPNQAVVLMDVLGREVARLTSAADGRVLWRPANALPAGLYLARSADGQPLARLLRAE